MKNETNDIVCVTRRRQDGQIRVVEKTCLETRKGCIEMKSHESLSERRSRSRTVETGNLEVRVVSSYESSESREGSCIVVRLKITDGRAFLVPESQVKILYDWEDRHQDAILRPGTNRAGVNAREEQWFR